MTVLIDGYNLLYAMGVLHGRAGPHGLEKARRRLLGLLRGAYGERAGDVTVVFDAAGAVRGAEEQLDYQGIHVHFAVHQQEADDLIELLIGRDSAPKRLTVVSDDHRIKQAARRRHCTALGCGEYLETLYRRRRRHDQPGEETEKAQAVSQEEMRHWLDEFAGLEDDPAVKDLFDPFDFGEEGP
jgi:predicted RNA-binding protein with PIN domain